MTEQKIVELESRIRVLETRGEVDEVHRTNIITRLTSIEDTLKWLVRLVLGGLLMAVVAYVAQGGLVQ